MGTVVRLLTEVLADGGRVLWDPPERPRLLIPKGVRERLETNRDTIREILRRATHFRDQAVTFIQYGRVLPRLALPDRTGERGCLSCGVDVEPGHFRCEVCDLAVKIALEATPCQRER